MKKKNLKTGTRAPELKRGKPVRVQRSCSAATVGIDQMVAALKADGWEQVTISIWKSPAGNYYRGPALAYHVMMCLPWPPNAALSGAERKP